MKRFWKTPRSIGWTLIGLVALPVIFVLLTIQFWSESRRHNKVQLELA